MNVTDPLMQISKGRIIGDLTKFMGWCEIFRRSSVSVLHICQDAFEEKKREPRFGIIILCSHDTRFVPISKVDPRVNHILSWQMVLGFYKHSIVSLKLFSRIKLNLVPSTLTITVYV